MSQKPDPYQVLGVAKTATEDEISKAFRKLSMPNHPDRFKNKSPEEQAEAASIYAAAVAANEIIGNKDRRRAYDAGGHKAVEDLIAGRTSAPADNSAIYDKTIQTIRARRTIKVGTVEDALDFFSGEGDEPASPPSPRPVTGTPVSAPMDDGAAARRARREALRAGQKPAPSPVPRVETYAPSPAPAPKPTPGPVTRVFTDTVAKVKEAVTRGEAGQMANVPLKALEDFREQLQELLDIVDASIENAKGGPDFKP